MPTRLRTYTEEEIELLMSGEKREIDKLLLHGISSIAAVLIPHMEKEDEMWKALGDLPTIRLRGEWIDEQIARQKIKNAMMHKVVESSILWALPLLLLFFAISIGNELMEMIRTKLTMVHKP